MPRDVLRTCSAGCRSVKALLAKSPYPQREPESGSPRPPLSVRASSAAQPVSAGRGDGTASRMSLDLRSEAVVKPGCPHVDVVVEVVERELDRGIALVVAPVGP